MGISFNTFFNYFGKTTKTPVRVALVRTSSQHNYETSATRMYIVNPRDYPWIANNTENCVNLQILCK